MRTRSTSGFTLIEMVVVVAIFAVLAVLVVGIFLSHNRFYEKQTAQTELGNTAREAADRIAEYVRQARSVETSYTYQSVAYDTDSDTIVLRLPSLDSNDNIIDGAYDFTIITRDPSQSSRLILLMETNPASVRPARTLELTKNLSAIEFLYDSADLAAVKRIEYSLSFVISGRATVTEQINGAATLRSKL